MYEQLSRYYDLFLDDALYDIYEQLISKYHESGHVLDLGCGTAPLAIKLSKSDYTVSGSDQSIEMLEEAYNNAVVNEVHINLFIHNILDPIAGVYDIYTMSSDVINYILNLEDVQTVFKNVSEVMTPDSILVFDFLRPQFIKEIIGHKEHIEVEDSVIAWHVLETDVQNQIEHHLEFEDGEEIHIQQTHPFKTYKKLLNQVGLFVVKKVKTKERIVCVCKKL